MSELEKERKAREEGHSQEIGAFMEWLGEQGVTLCEYDEKWYEYRPTHKTIYTWLAQYFGIDEKKAEEERRALLDQLRAAQ